MHLSNYCLNNTILGLEEFSGIPGTVGGSVYINLHYFQFLLSQFLTSAIVLEKQHGTLLTRLIMPGLILAIIIQHSINENHYLMEATFHIKTRVLNMKLPMHAADALKLFATAQVAILTKIRAAASLEIFMSTKLPSCKMVKKLSLLLIIWMHSA